jgi:hypothetical protein
MPCISFNVFHILLKIKVFLAVDLVLESIELDEGHLDVALDEDLPLFLPLPT